MKYGVEGYGLYFYCVEIIAGNLSTENITFELKHDAETIAHRLKMDTLRVEEIMKWMVDAKLFQIDSTTERIVCYGLAKRLDISTSHNPAFKKFLTDPDFQKVLESISKYQPLIAEENRTEEKRKEDKKPPRHKHGDKVLLTEEGYQALCDKHTKPIIERYIEKVNDYCVTYGKTYVDYARGIGTFIRRDKEKGIFKASADTDPVEKRPVYIKDCPVCKGEYQGKKCQCGFMEEGA